MVVERGTESQPLKLLPFQIVRAMVAEGGIDRVVLNLKQHHLNAETKIPLKTGQNLRLQVISTHPQIQFKIMEEPELKHLSRVLHLIHYNIKLPSLINLLQNRHSQNFEPFSDKIQNLLQSLKGLLQSNPGQLTGKNLSMLWNLLGLDLEALLAAGKRTQAQNGLKTALLMHVRKLQNEGKSSETIENALEQFKLYQICRYRLAQENVWFVPLPFSFLKQGYLLAEKWKQNDHKNSENNHCWKMTINLKMSFLGNLQILLLFEKLDLRLRILCDCLDKAEIISRSLSQLKDNLTSVSLLNFSVGTGAQDPPRWLVQRLAQDDTPFLNAEV